jgi:hypothetical protein
MRARQLLVVAVLLGAVSLATGCSSEQTSRTTTQTAYNSAPQADSSSPPPASTTTTTTEEPDSVLGATAHLVGTIILLPFRIIGLVV